MIKIIEGKQCLQYESWLSNPLVKSFMCKKVTKVVKDEKETFVSSSEKTMVLTTSFLFVIDIARCSEKGYAIIESRYNYSSIESVRAGESARERLFLAGKEYIYMVIFSNQNGQKKKLLYYVSMRDTCLGELQRRIQ